jgi:diguanylate cyclase
LRVACDLAEEIRVRVQSSEFKFEGVHIPLTLSFGVSEREPASTESAEVLFERADQLLYAAKAAGRNCVRC